MWRVPRSYVGESIEGRGAGHVGTWGRLGGTWRGPLGRVLVGMFVESACKAMRGWLYAGSASERGGVFMKKTSTEAPASTGGAAAKGQAIAFTSVPVPTGHAPKAPKGFEPPAGG